MTNTRTTQGAVDTAQLRQAVSRLDAPRQNVIVTTGATPLVAGQSGAMVLINGVHDITLPAPSAGLHYKFRKVVAAGGGSATIAAPTACLQVAAVSEGTDGVPDLVNAASQTTFNILAIAVAGAEVEAIASATAWYLFARGAATGTVVAFTSA
jgi:hypothetical protein